MANNQGIIHACAIQGDGTSEALHGDDIAKVIKDEKLAWVHLDGNNPQSREWLKNEIKYLDHIIVDALLAEETRPRILDFDEGAMMILRGVNLNENSVPEDMISIRLWVDAHRIISIERRPLKATQDIHKRLMEGRGPKNAGDFVVDLSARLFERMEPIFSELDENLDDVEEKIIQDPGIHERSQIIDIRRKAIIFKRYISPQKEVMSHLKGAEQPWLDTSHRRRLQESSDRLIRYSEDLDTIRERAQIVKEELASTLSDKMNKNMYVLSVIAAVFLPLGFLTGLLGINVGGIPGADNDFAFYVFCGFLTALVAMQIILFKKLKWF